MKSYESFQQSKEHSKAAALFKGAAEADLNSIATNKQNFEKLVATVTVGKAAVEADIKSIGEHRKAIDQATGDIVEAARKGAARLQEIDASKVSAEASLGATKDAFKTASEALKLVTEARRDAEAAKKEVDNAFEATKPLTLSMAESHKASTQQSAEITTLLGSANEATISLKKVLEHLAKSDGIASRHEARVEDLSKKLEALNARAESLLPGFTSTGLAHSFNEQKKRFAIPQTRWLHTFQWCIVALVVVALPSFINAIWGTPEDTWGIIFQKMAMRLPIVVPLVWLAIYAGRNYMVSLRLEEDYAYKETISRAFEGYKREMKDIPVGEANNPTPLTTLCGNVLTAIAERPGRIYDGKHKDITPLNETLAAAENLHAELRLKHTATV